MYKLYCWGKCGWNISYFKDFKLFVLLFKDHIKMYIEEVSKRNFYNLLLLIIFTALNTIKINIFYFY